MFTAVVATLAVNIAANVVSPANDFANAFPRAISFKTGGLITGILGIVIMPWRLLADPSGYIFTWLLGYSGGLGLDRRRAHRRLLDRAEDAAAPRGSLPAGRRVPLHAGWHMPGVVATLAGCAAAWAGLVVPALRPVYDYAWFVGFAVAGAVYLAAGRATLQR